MIMIIVVIYIFFKYYVIFDEQLKITFRKSSGPPEKIYSSLFTHSHLLHSSPYQLAKKLPILPPPRIIF